MSQIRLANRGIVKVVGDEARAFLQRVLSCDMAKVSPETASYGALLTPQGKIFVDFLIVEAPAAMGGGFLLDTPLALAPELMKRLNLYKLRADVIIEDISAVLTLVAGWNGEPMPQSGHVFNDPRSSQMGWRQITTMPLEGLEADMSAYTAHRIANAIPEGGQDFIYSDTFPHEANLDRLGGVDFAKGCYIGQEVVSRMQHKTEVRKRIIPLSYHDFAPECGTEIMAGEKSVGLMGSGMGGKGLALVRLDRARDALAAGLSFTAGGVPVTLHVPEAS